MKKPIPLKYAYRVIGPAPLILVSSFHKGKPNVQTVAWSTPFQHMPPEIILIISRENYSHECITKGKEFVVNIPGPGLLKKAIGCGNCSGKDVDKFKKFGLTAIPASKVKPPLIKECIAHLECKLIMPKYAKDDIIVGRVVAAWANPGVFDEVWNFTGKKNRFPIHLGGNNFTTPSKITKA